MCEEEVRLLLSISEGGKLFSPCPLLQQEVVLLSCSPALQGPAGAARSEAALTLTRPVWGH